jgi:hypothetical protein
MKNVAMLLLALLGLGLSGCDLQKSSSVLEIQVRKADFVVDGHSYATSADLTTALKKLPSPDLVHLIHAEGTTVERTNEAIAAIKNAGVKARIGWVGNEVFY